METRHVAERIGSQAFLATVIAAANMDYDWNVRQNASD